MAEPTQSAAHPPGTAPIVSHAATPPGVLPRRAQVWMLVGVAGGILLIILFTGREPAPRRAAVAPSLAATLAPNPDQLRSYQQRLEAADTRPQPTPPGLRELQPTPPDDRTIPERQGAPRSQDTLVEERRRREYDSLFASNVVQSPTLATESPRTAATKRSAASVPMDRAPSPPSLDEVANAVLRASATRSGTLPATGAQAPPATPPTSVPPAQVQPSPRPPEVTAADGPLHRIIEGTIIDTVLTNRLDGSAAAPVNCLVSTPIYAANQQVLIPAGARILGATKPVQSFGETRLAVAFNRIVMPNGRTYSLDHFVGLNAIGDAGLHDQVNQHYLSTFGAAAAVGLISGLSQYLGSGLLPRDSPVIVTGSVGDATSQATAQTMSRFLNRLPIVTIREGHRVKVYLTSDLQLPAYQSSPSTRDRGGPVTARIQP